MQRKEARGEGTSIRQADTDSSKCVGASFGDFTIFWQVPSTDPHLMPLLSSTLPYCFERLNIIPNSYALNTKTKVPTGGVVGGVDLHFE
jgi:hypothetical protein